MKYLTYEEYVKINGTLNESAFNRNIDRACGAIDNATFGRVEKMREVPRRVKTCCRDLVEYYAAKSGIGEKQATYIWKAAGSVSESAKYETVSAKEMAFEVEKLIYDHLYSVTDDEGTPLLYRGARA